MLFAMKFRKSAIMFVQSTAFYISTAMLYLVMFVFVRLWPFLIFAAVMALLAWINPSSYNEFVTIDEHGISCEKAGKQLWDYDWDSIVELRKSNRSRTKAIDVIVYDKFGKPEPYALPGQYFLLGKAAKEAIKRYYKPRTADTEDG